MQALMPYQNSSDFNGFINPSLRIVGERPLNWLTYLENIKSYPIASHRNQYIQDLHCLMNQSEKITDFILEKVVEVAGLLCDWNLQLKALDLLSRIHLSDREAYALWKMGKWQHAYDCLHQSMFVSPTNQANYDLYHYLTELSHRQCFARYEHRAVAQNLSLEPLSIHHCDEYLWQSWDSETARLCCLPHLTHASNWYGWFADQQQLTDQSTFAVMHDVHGFIGVVSIVVHHNVGFFYYWIGPNYQRSGFGPLAGKLLLKLAEEGFGVGSCYAKVLRSNLPSVKALRKMEFNDITHVTGLSNDDEMFFYYGPPKSPKANCLELYQLLSDMRSTTEITIPIKWLIQ